MCTLCPSRFSRGLNLLVLVVVLAQPAFSGETLRVYGPTSPSPAIIDAATGFGQRHGITVDVHSGPVGTWLDEAAKDADLIYATADFMMSNLIRTESLKIDPATVTPLYLRPCVILVRPDNPKGIKDLPDLLDVGVRVMVVTGSGQTGLWEDMAGRLGDVRALRSLRRNIVYFAPTSDDAMKAWKQRDDIDAWITWNVWYIPLRDSAKLVPVSRDYRIYRQCSIALTQGGRSKPLARAFVQHLISDEGARVFESWGWMPPPSASNPLSVQSDVCVVCRIDSDSWANDVGQGLTNIRELLRDYERLGIPASEVHVSAVFDGDAAYWLLADKAYARLRPGSEVNPNAALVRELLDLGVSLELCAKTMGEHGWKSSDVIFGVKIVAGAHPRIVDLELQGYAYLRF